MPRAKLKSALVLYNVPSKNFGAARRFYSVLLGSDDFVRAPNRDVESYFRPVSPDGIDLTITARQDDREQTTCYFAVPSLQGAMDELQRVGGTLVVAPRDVRITSNRVREAYVAQERQNQIQANEQVGRMAVLLDPDGNHVGLIELAEHAHRHFRWGKSQRPLEPEQLQELDQLKRLMAAADRQQGGDGEGQDEAGEGADPYIRGIGDRLHELVDELVQAMASAGESSRTPARRGTRGAPAPEDEMETSEAETEREGRESEARERPAEPRSRQAEVRKRTPEPRTRRSEE
ncbi:MAG TPA: hypothetical protein VNA89_02465 [Gemmatimonadaceae bacterium]|nr:hypothetical protein [Gemmatimonadaceae bacterium]